MKENITTIGAAILIILVCLLMIFLPSAIAFWVWNCSLVTVFNLPKLGYWTFFGIVTVLQCIFNTGNISNKNR